MVTTEQSKTPPLHVAPGPHVADTSITTRGMMVDVLIGLVPVLAAAVLFFGLYAVKQVALCLVGCLVAETLFLAMRGRKTAIFDGSAAVTGVILGLSLPATAPWYVGVIGAFAAIGLGKAVFGGLGHNLFNPAMVGRAFVMIAFPAALGASAYVLPEAAVEAVTSPTPLTVLKQLGESTPILALLIGKTNGSLGETSALACLLGGLYLCARRSASWEIPAGAIVATGAVSLLTWLSAGMAAWTPLHELFGGAFLFGAFFIATDPVSSPLTPKGKWVFGAGFGLLVLLIRKLSGYPEGVMFAVLLMNALTPLINRATATIPLGGPVQEKN